LLIVLAALPLFAGCPGTLVSDNPTPSPRIEVSAEQMTFGSLEAGSTESQTLTIHSAGTDPLQIGDFLVTGSEAFGFEDSGTARALEPGQSTDLIVTFEPLTDGSESAELEIHSNDSAGNSPVIVELNGGGMAPVIELDPAEVDFGEPEIGCGREQEIAIRNTGSATLVLEQIEFSPSSDEYEFSGYPDDGTTLAPGETHTVTIYYEPRDDQEDTGTVHVHSNDPWTPDALATQRGAGTLTSWVEDTHEVEQIHQVDFLWVVDNSPSMEDLQENLALNLPAIMDLLDVVGVDYQIAVVTTEDPGFRGPVITPASPDAAAAFAEAMDVGIAGAGPNTGLQTGLDALSPPYTDPGGAHEGFLRDDAGLRVIFVSNSVDQSSDPVTDIVTGYQALKGNPDHVILSSFIDIGNAPRYQEAAAWTGGLIDHVANSWCNTLANLLWFFPTWSDAFELSETPLPETVEVLVEEVPMANGWTFDPVRNAVVFEPDYLPEHGETLTIRYRPVGACP